MKSLATLIKLQKTLVDEQRQHLRRLLEHLDEIEHSITHLEICKAREQAATQDEAARLTYGAFLKKMVEQGRTLEKERQTAEMAVKIAQDKLAQLFRGSAFIRRNERRTPPRDDRTRRNRRRDA